MRLLLSPSRLIEVFLMTRLTMHRAFGDCMVCGPYRFCRSKAGLIFIISVSTKRGHALIKELVAKYVIRSAHDSGTLAKLSITTSNLFISLVPFTASRKATFAHGRWRPTLVITSACH